MAQVTCNRNHLPPVARRRDRLFVRPKLLAIICLVVLTGLGWIYVGLMVAGMESAVPQSPGASLPILDMLADRSGLSGWGRAALEALCRPSFGVADPGSGVAGFAVVFLMWTAMLLAMMLPTAGPMILTYAEMAENAAREGERAASPLWLIAGYGLVWFGFAVVAAALQLALARAALLDPSMGSASGLFSGAVFVAAGAYQFSALKHACVTRCQQPVPFFVANWSENERRVFPLGVRQGLYCVGCCWAVMLVMFAVGVMNVIWMAALGFIMAAEKIATTTRFSKVIGLAFTVIGIAFIATAVAAHWPVRTG